jgi:hypothetical protein
MKSPPKRLYRFAPAAESNCAGLGQGEMPSWQGIRKGGIRRFLTTAGRRYERSLRSQLDKRKAPAKGVNAHREIWRGQARLCNRLEVHALPQSHSRSGMGFVPQL